MSGAYYTCRELIHACAMPAAGYIGWGSQCSLLIILTISTRYGYECAILTIQKGSGIRTSIIINEMMYSYRSVSGFIHAPHTITVRGSNWYIVSIKAN